MGMVKDEMSRTALLIGAEGLDALQQAHVLVVGLGGVGGYVVEQLVRSGVGELTIVDGDTVQTSNINRQIIAFGDTVGQPKSELWAERLRRINPDVKLHVLNTFIKDEATDELVQRAHYDYAVDAIDSLSPKVHLIKSLVREKIPFISSMGAGAKIDPTQVRIARIDKVQNCTLSRMVRKRLRKLDVPLKFPVVYSTELPDKEAIELTDGEQNKKSIAGTVSHIPAVFGCFITYAVLRHLIEKPNE